MKNAVFWGVASCRCSGLNRRFGGSIASIRVEKSSINLNSLPNNAGSSLADFSTLNMEAIRSSETSV
jgi:hypothetical protein